MSHKIGYFAEEISKQLVEREVWLFLTAYTKIWERRKMN